MLQNASAVHDTWGLRSFPRGLDGTRELEGRHTQWESERSLLGICESWRQKRQASLWAFSGGEAGVEGTDLRVRKTGAPILLDLVGSPVKVA